jgi:hypothetical protein
MSEATITRGAPKSGAEDLLRIPDVFIDINGVAIGAETTIWTPGAGKKFRLLGMMLGSSAGGTLTFRDGTGGTVRWRQMIGTNAPLWVPWPGMGNGILSAAAGNVLTVQLSVAGNLTGTLLGTLE